MRRSPFQISQDLKDRYSCILTAEFGSGFTCSESGNAWEITLKDGFCVYGAHWFSEPTLQNVNKTISFVIPCFCDDCIEAKS